MAKLPQVSSKMLLKILQREGYQFISQKGSHIKLRKLSPARKTIIIPNHKVIRPGTLNNILKIAEITKEALYK